MKRLVATIALVLALLIPALLDAQTSVTGGTGKVRFSLGRYGNLKFYDPSGVQQLDRSSILVALDSVNVMDYVNDAWYLMTPTVTAGGVADTVATALIDNTYPTVAAPPDVIVRHNVYAWHNDYYVMEKFSVKNYSSGSYKLYLGIGVIPYPSAAYGGETVLYDATKKMAYYYRNGEVPYTGFVLLGQDPYSFHALDWDVYSPTDPASDAGTDSMHWVMTSKPGFDAGLNPTGVNGSFFNLNAGSRTIAAGDSTSFTVAYLSGTSLAGLRQAADSAVSRFGRVFTSVEQISPAVPENFMLRQNYPNPFNPSTKISFAIKNAGFTTLKVYNTLGQEVATLVSEELAPGAYEKAFDAKGMSSGVYLYKLTSGSYSETRKMMLVK